MQQSHFCSKVADRRSVTMINHIIVDCEHASITAKSKCYMWQAEEKDRRRAEKAESSTTTEQGRNNEEDGFLLSNSDITMEKSSITLRSRIVAKPKSSASKKRTHINLMNPLIPSLKQTTGRGAFSALSSTARCPSHLWNTSSSARSCTVGTKSICELHIWCFDFASLLHPQNTESNDVFIYR
jgi:hypothetical protein